MLVKANDCQNTICTKELVTGIYSTFKILLILISLTISVPQLESQEFITIRIELFMHFQNIFLISYFHSYVKRTLPAIFGERGKKTVPYCKIQV